MNKVNIPISLSTQKTNSLKKQLKIKKTSKPTRFTYIEYFKEFKEQLFNYKLTELKEISKYNKIKGAKTKQEYMSKIHDFFVKTMNAIKIQKVCRGFFVRLFFNVKGNMKNITQCVNDTDFYTLEPLNVINFTKFFIIKEISDNCNIFYYGFNILSLMSMYKKNETILNPYNRQSLPIKTIQDIFSHYQLLLILFKETVILEDTIENIINFKIPSKQQINNQFGKKDIISPNTSNISNLSTSSPSTRITRSSYRTQLDNTVPPMTLERLVMEEILYPNSGIINTYIIRNYHTNTNSPIQSPIQNLENQHNQEQNYRNENDDENDDENEEITNVYHSNDFVNSNQLENTTILENIQNKLFTFKQQPINTRINELFMYIDQLGNYTNANWFFQLNKRSYYIFYSQLRELWTFRAQIPNNVKNCICPLGDPFLQSSSVFNKPYDQITDDEILQSCLDVIENIIMTSTDIEYRKIGCLHVLTALTIVSHESRLQYGYLFDLVDSMPLSRNHFRW